MSGAPNSTAARVGAEPFGDSAAALDGDAHGGRESQHVDDDDHARARSQRQRLEPGESPVEANGGAQLLSPTVRRTSLLGYHESQWRMSARGWRLAALKSVPMV